MISTSDELFSYDMMYFEYNRGALIHCWYRMFEHFDLLEKFEISADKM